MVTLSAIDRLATAEREYTILRHVLPFYQELSRGPRGRKEYIPVLFPACIL